MFTKKTTLVLACLLSAFSATAQRFIPKAGVTISKSFQNTFSYGFSGNSAKRSIHPRAGFMIGMACRTVVKKGEKGDFFFQSELNFIQKGYRGQTVATTTNGTEKYTTTNTDIFTINYLELPVMATWDFGNEKTRYHVGLGPSFAYSIGGAYKLKSSSNVGGVNSLNSATGKVKFGDEPPFNNSDYYFDTASDIGLQFGGGVAFGGKLMIDLRYGMGFTNLIERTNSQNRCLQVTAGLPLH
jgi:hypothetical protein